MTWHLGFIHLWIIFIPGLSKKSSLSMKSILMLEHHRERCSMRGGKVTVQQINIYETCGFCVWLITVKPPLNVQWFAVYLWLNFNYHDSKISTVSNFPQFGVQIHCSPLPEQEKPLSIDSYMHVSKCSLTVSIKPQGLSECQSLEHGIKLCCGAVHTLCIQGKLKWVISLY